MKYKYTYIQDYLIIFVWAVAWFKNWLQQNINLKNFINCELYKSIHKSHLYHHSQYIIHIVYKLVNLNKN